MTRTTTTYSNGVVTIAYPAGSLNHPAVQARIRLLASRGYKWVIGQGAKGNHREYMTLTQTIEPETDPVGTYQKANHDNT